MNGKQWQKAPGKNPPLKGMEIPPWATHLSILTTAAPKGRGLNVGVVFLGPKEIDAADVKKLPPGKEEKHCDYCDKEGHTTEGCYLRLREQRIAHEAARESLEDRDEDEMRKYLPKLIKSGVCFSLSTISQDTTCKDGKHFSPCFHAERVHAPEVSVSAP